MSTDHSKAQRTISALQQLAISSIGPTDFNHPPNIDENYINKQQVPLHPLQKPPLRPKPNPQDDEKEDKSKYTGLGRPVHPVDGLVNKNPDPKNSPPTLDRNHSGGNANNPKVVNPKSKLPPECVRRLSLGSLRSNKSSTNTTEGKPKNCATIKLTKELMTSPVSLWDSVKATQGSSHISSTNSSNSGNNNNKSVIIDGPSPTTHFVATTTDPASISIPISVLGSLNNASRNAEPLPSTNPCTMFSNQNNRHLEDDIREDGVKFTSPAVSIEFLRLAIPTPASSSNKTAPAAAPITIPAIPHKLSKNRIDEDDDYSAPTPTFIHHTDSPKKNALTNHKSYSTNIGPVHCPSDHDTPRPTLCIGEDCVLAANGGPLAHHTQQSQSLPQLPQHDSPTSDHEIVEDGDNDFSLPTGNESHFANESIQSAPACSSPPRRAHTFSQPSGSATELASNQEAPAPSFSTPTISPGLMSRKITPLAPLPLDSLQYYEACIGSRHDHAGLVHKQNLLTKPSAFGTSSSNVPPQPGATTMNVPAMCDFPITNGHNLIDSFTQDTIDLNHDIFGNKNYIRPKDSFRGVLPDTADAVSISSISAASEIPNAKDMDDIGP